MRQLGGDKVGISVSEILILSLGVQCPGVALEPDPLALVLGEEPPGSATAVVVEDAAMPAGHRPEQPEKQGARD